jgi:uncharacterized PurR-regulated membrane protein YhhQ (DUF165 family)
MTSGYDMTKKLLIFTLFLMTVPLANYLISNVGTFCVDQGPCLIPVGFGLMAPSGVLVIGLALVLRDWVHETSGLLAALLAVLVGSLLSLAFSPATVAVASFVAFAFSEVADTLVYSKLREKSKPMAVLASQLLGAFVDSMLFVYIAFGSLEFSLGNSLGKIYAGIAVAFIIYLHQKNKWRKRGETL